MKQLCAITFTLSLIIIIIIIIITNIIIVIIITVITFMQSIYNYIPEKTCF
jgi:hypothetical protein